MTLFYFIYHKYLPIGEMNKDKLWGSEKQAKRRRVSWVGTYPPLV
jgi:hypothetical protein